MVLEPTYDSGRELGARVASQLVRERLKPGDKGQRPKQDAIDFMESKLQTLAMRGASEEQLREWERGLADGFRATIREFIAASSTETIPFITETARL